MSSPSHDKLPNCIREMLKFESCKFDYPTLKSLKCSEHKKNLKDCFEREKFWASAGKATSSGKESAKRGTEKNNYVQD